MKRIAEPWWMFLVNTFPLTLFMVIMAGEYSVVRTLLSPAQKETWLWFALSMLVMMMITVFCAIFLLARRKKVPALWALGSLFLWIGWIYIYGMNIGSLMPTEVPNWMMSENVLLYAGAFLMPSLGYYLLLLVVRFTENIENQVLWGNFLVVMAIPLAGYFFVQVILPLWQPVDMGYLIHAFVVVVILATLTFLFFLVRGFYIIAAKKTAQWRKFGLAWKIPFALILPVVGLLLNNGIILQDMVDNMEGIFGDFNHYWFYALAIANGIVICLPNLQITWYRIMLFALRMVTLAYTGYFLFVFLPFLPLSLVAIIVFGTGVLMLTPLILFIIHINELIYDFMFLAERYHKAMIWTAAGLCFLVIPAAVTVSFLKDRRVLHDALDYVYSPDYFSEQRVPDSGRLETVFSAIRDNRNRNQIIITTQTPYLSALYRRIVLDNLTLSEQKLNTMERVFMGAEPLSTGSDFFMNAGVALTGINTKSAFYDSTGVFHSRINLEITNHGGPDGLAEYVTEFELPEGCFITDYDLVIEGKREPGLLVEKRSALWVFSMIRQVRRDPGVLWYKTGNRIGFHIYPFGGGEIRQTGIELMHKEPVTLSIDGKSVHLGDTLHTGNFTRSGFVEGVDYVSRDEKRNLKRVLRKPYFHFIVDISAAALSSTGMYAETIDYLMDNYPELSEGARFSFVNSSVTAIEQGKHWADELKNQQFKGGFFLDRAVRSLLADHYLEQSGTYPVIVVVSGMPEKAVIMDDFGDMEFACPDEDHFYFVGNDMEPHGHALFNNPGVAADSIPGIRRPRSVLAYHASDGSKIHVPDNREPSVVIVPSGFNPEAVDAPEGLWNIALHQQGLWCWFKLHPEQEGKYWRHLVRSSFTTGIMTPLTSYIVVENKAQQAALLRKQKKVLEGHRQLDLNDETVSMTEPGFLLPVILLMLVLGYRHRKTGF